MIAIPKNIDAPSIPSGFHCPNINAASARNPSPATPPLNSPEYVTIIIAPPSDANAPEIITPIYLILKTLIPAASAACGCSPHALSLIPKLVLYIINVLIAINPKTSHVVGYVFVNNNAPIIGISDNTGISCGTNPILIPIFPLPVIALAINIVNEPAIIFIAVPLIT